MKWVNTLFDTRLKFKTVTKGSVIDFKLFLN